MTAGTSDFATLASSSLPAVNGESWNGYTNTSSTSNGPPAFLSQANSSSSTFSTTGVVRAGVGVGVGPPSTSMHMHTGMHSGMDLNRIQQLTHSLQAPPKPDAASVNTEFVSVSEMIHQRRHLVLDKLFISEMNKTRRRCDTMHARRMKKDWDEQKSLYMKELVGDRRLGGSNVANFESMTPTLPQSQSRLTAQTVEHLRLMKEYNQDSDMDIIYAFDRLASESPSYSAAWKLIFAVKQGKSDSPLGRAISTMSHLARQFRAHVENRVRSATASGQADGYSSNYTGMARTVATYVFLTVGSQASHWATVYYCLRCGDFVAAKQVVDARNPGHSLGASLEAHAKQQGSDPYFWDQVTFANAIGGILPAQSPQDDFEGACWVILAGNEDFGTSPHIKTIEDFLYVSLWQAIFEGTEQALIAVGTRIKELGPKHFHGDDSSNRWSFSMPLMLAQQYRRAILHLAESEEGILQATHLSLFVPELKDLGGDGDQTSSASMLAELVVEHASILKRSSASNALEYLVRIPNELEKRKRIVELVADSRQFEELGGALSGDGVRRGENAALDKHFPPEGVCGILTESAMLARSRNNTKDTLELLNLAEQYDDLLVVLNEKLASLLNQNPGHEKE